MNIFIPDKDSLFFLESLARKFIASSPFLLLPEYPLVCRPLREIDFTDEQKKTFSGCEYRGIHRETEEGNVRFYFSCILQFGEESLETRLYIASASIDDAGKDAADLSPELVVKRKSRVIRRACMTCEDGGWEFSSVDFLKKKS